MAKRYRPGATAGPVPLWRSFAGAIYDGILLLALWLTASLVASFFQAIGNYDSTAQWMQGLRIYLFVLGLLLFGWFWTHGGQTPGLKAWRLRLERSDGEPLRWPVAAVRYTAMLVCWGISLAPVLLATPLRASVPHLEGIAWLCLGLFCIGCIWAQMDRQHRSPQDHVAGTRIRMAHPQGARIQAPPLADTAEPPPGHQQE